jgi:ATP-dependent protease HslVU (ClpYQ) peptidase subunit
MTTIAYVNGIIACDSCYSTHDVIYTRRPKIQRLSSGGLLGFSGDTDTRAVVDMFDKIKSERHLPSRKSILELQIDTDALFIMPNGRVFNIECGYVKGVWEGGVYEWGEKFAATGSGGKFALVAMECGKSAVAAVVLACRRDVHSCLPVHQLSLGQRKTVPPRLKQAPRRRR